MIMAFIISLWFINSFRKGWGPKVISLIVLVCVGIFLYYSLETDADKVSKGTIMNLIYDR